MIAITFRAKTGGGGVYMNKILKVLSVDFFESF